MGVGLVRSLPGLDFPGGSDGKGLPAKQEMQVRFLGWEDLLGWRRERQPTPVFLPGESPWTEKPGGVQSMGSQRVRYN